MDKNIEREPVLIHRRPEPLLHPGNLHRDFVEMPFITGSRQPAPDLVVERLAELETPLPPVDPLRGSIMADGNAACGEDLIDMAQAERKAKIEPDGEADDLGWALSN